MWKNDEELFLALYWYHIGYSTNKNLIEQGYVNNEINLTQKATDFMNRFIEENKEILLRVIKAHGDSDDRSAVMADAGITEIAIFLKLANLLVKEKRLAKTEDGVYYPID